MRFSLAKYTPNNMNLKPTHKAVKDYYAVLDQYARLNITNEGAVRSACQSLLESCARQEKWTFVPEYSMPSLKKRESLLMAPCSMIMNGPEATGKPKI